MLNISSDIRIYLYNGSTDMRKGINGLSLLAESILSDQFSNGSMFVFRGSSSPRLAPQALTEPYVTVSRHTALLFDKPILCQ